MTLEPREYSTSIAKLVRVRPDFVEIHYAPGCTLTLEDMTEVQELRRKIMGTKPYGMLTIIPDDVDYQLNAMDKDHLSTDRSQGNVLATAVVAKATMIELLVKLYFAHFPQMHRIHVTDNEKEARAWLSTQLEQHASTGS
ncbi:MAG: STAS/SEC14 domain-containing protein [Flavobacteriales bacterium]|nr:STAS/SEC14 domain-containing protein [Flavobacteriales bacterium]MBK9196698.1 STAS/SEC14 domain-containing protein [Flavobacteriales bacterium]